MFLAKIIWRQFFCFATLSFASLQHHCTTEDHLLDRDDHFNIFVIKRERGHVRPDLNILAANLPKCTKPITQNRVYTYLINATKKTKKQTCMTIRKIHTSGRKSQSILHLQTQNKTTIVADASNDQHFHLCQVTRLQTANWRKPFVTYIQKQIRYICSHSLDVCIYA